MSDKLIDHLLKHLSIASEDFNVKKGKVIAHIAGGTAVNYYTGVRMSDDVDIQWSHRMILSGDARHFMSEDPDGNPLLVAVDVGFSESIGLFHPDWKQDANVIAEFPKLIVKMITPVDLVVSKIGRFFERDREDICALAEAIHLDPEEIRARAEDALEYYVGNEDYVRKSLELGLDLIKECSRDNDDVEP